MFLCVKKVLHILSPLISSTLLFWEILNIVWDQLVFGQIDLFYHGGLRNIKATIQILSTTTLISLYDLGEKLCALYWRLK